MEQGYQRNTNKERYNFFFEKDTIKVIREVEMKFDKYNK